MEDPSNINKKVTEVDPVLLVEEGIALAVDDAKSEAGGSVTTVPSVASGDHADGDTNTKLADCGGTTTSSTTANADTSTPMKDAFYSRKCNAILAVVILLLAGAVIGGAVAATQKSKTSKTSSSSSSSSSASVVTDYDDEGNVNAIDDDGFVFEKPFGDFELRAFSTDILQGYASRSDLEADLTMAVKDMVNNLLEQNLQWFHSKGNGDPNSGNDDGANWDDDWQMMEMEEGEWNDDGNNRNDDDRFNSNSSSSSSTVMSDDTIVWQTRPPVIQDEEDAAAAAAQAGMTATTSSAKKQASQTKVQKATTTSSRSQQHHSSKTNNQERDADEADRVKNDATHVYGAYGDYIVVWDRANGTITTRLQMVADDKDEDDEAEPVVEQPDFDDDWSEYMHMNGSNEMYIESLQLTDQHVLVTLMEDQWDRDDGPSLHLRVYRKPTPQDPKLTLVATKEFASGFFMDSVYLENSNSIQMTTQMNTNSYSMVADPLAVHNFPPAVQASKSLYLQEATKLAEETIIPAFVQRMVTMLGFDDDSDDDSMPAMLQMNNWRFDTAGSASSADTYGVSDEALQGIVRITSLRVDDLPMTPPTDDNFDRLVTSSASFFGPNSPFPPYATQDSIVISVNRYDWNSDTQVSQETLFLIHLTVDPDDATAAFSSIGHLEGHLPNKRGIDIQGNDLRVAATHQKWMPMDNVWSICGDNWHFEDTCANDDNWNDCFDVAIDGCSNVIKTGCPYEFTCGDDPFDAANEVDVSALSSTDNYIVVFDLSEPGDMAEIGRVRIGEPHEVITAVHFAETFSYAMTFDLRDPFYVLNLEAGQAPEVAGSLKLDGFSMYLQPLNEDATLLVGIGQNVTGERMDQRPDGLMVTVFDVSEPSSPQVVASTMLMKKNNTDVFSNALFDFRAVQYNDGRLVIPLDYYDYSGEDEINQLFETMFAEGDEFNDEEFMASVELLENNHDSQDFSGFLVLDVINATTQGIQELFRVDHSQNGCRDCLGLGTSRSFFFEDDNTVMTMQNSLVVSTDVTTGQELWSLNVTAIDEA